jgi:hypothetical protein
VLVAAMLATSGAGCSTLVVSSPRAAVPTVEVGQVPLGVYAGPGDPRAVANFAARTGSKPSLASDYLPRTEGWAGMVRAKALERYLAPWSTSPYRLVLGVPLIPTHNGRAVGTLAGGASGHYDAEFTRLARTLVSYRLGDAVLRLGWEFNGTWYPWAVTDHTDATNFAAYFRHVVTAMRAVPGTAFRFVWNPTSGPTPVAADAAYPGNAFVDYVGLDLYDQVWGLPLDPVLAWPSYLGEANGLSWAASFAAAHHKALSIPEWGVTVRSDGHGLGDDPVFVARMAQWISAHDVAFTSYFAVDAPDGAHDILDRRFSRSRAAFESSFAAVRPAVLAPTPG